METISQIGESILIRKIGNWCHSGKIGSSFPGRNQDFLTKVPMGDDACVVKLLDKSSLAVTTDTLVEGTHFNLTHFSSFLDKKEQWISCGYKAIAVNLSDLAAMGHVRPLFALVTLGLRGDISVDSVENLYTGMKKLTKKYHFSIIGGDIIRSEKSIISITLIGKMIGKRVLTRSGAKIGDVLMVSGPLGLSSAGLKVLMKRLRVGEGYLKTLVDAHIYPKPKMEEGKILADEESLATSLIDSSDDLMTSLEILSEKSRVGFELNLDQVLIHPAIKKISKELKVSPFSFIIYGGEDYQLIFTVHPSKVDLIRKRIPSSYLLGVVKPRSFGIQLKIDQKPFRIKDSRFNHF